MVKAIKKYIFMTFVLFFILYGLKVFAYALPSRQIQLNIEKSLTQIEKEGLYPKILYDEREFYNYSSCNLDNCNDLCFMNVSYWANEYSPFAVAAADYTRYADGGRSFSKESESGEGFLETAYGRQWFGMNVILRPLLLFFTLPELRIISMVVFIMLLLIAVLKLTEELGKTVALIFAFSILCGNVVVIPVSFSLSATFYITLVATIILTNMYKRKQEIDIGAFIFVIGAVTPYFDFWVTPLVTFLYIATLVLLFEYKRKRLNNFMDCLLICIRMGVLWLIGAFGVWLLKWIAATIVTGENVVMNALNEIIGWTYKRMPEWGPQTTGGLIKECLYMAIITVFPVNVIFSLMNRFGRIKVALILMIILAVFMTCLFRNKRKVKELYFSAILLLVSLIPYAFYIVAHSSSFNHIGSAYRVQCGGVFALLCAIIFFIKHKKEDVGER